MSRPPIPPLWNEKAGWVAVAVASTIFIASILIVAYLWVQCSEKPPPGSFLPEPVTVTATPQFPKMYIKQ